MKKNNLQLLFIFLLSIFSNTITSAQDCVDTDCVWPGDANQNGICNNVDLLWFTYANFAEGPTRNNATVSWTPQTAEDWTNTFPDGINLKHADTDGNGIVEGTDFYSWTTYSNSTNDSFTGLMGSTIEGEDLYITSSDDNPNPGDTISLIINLGSEDNPIEDIVGIAFTVLLDTALFKEQITFPMNYDNSWMGTPFVDMNVMDKYDPFVDPLHREVAIVRNDNSPISGFGEIARFDIIIEDVIIGVDKDEIFEKSSLGVSFPLEMENIFAVTTDLEEKRITVRQDSLIINESVDAVTKPVSRTNTVQIFPNPTRKQLHISATTRIHVARLTTYFGKEMLQWQSNQLTQLVSVSQLPSGVYLLHLEMEDRVEVHTIVVQ